MVMAFTKPDDFTYWMRWGRAVNGWRQSFEEGEPGTRGGYAMLSEPVMDANPRVVFKGRSPEANGNLVFFPFPDGARDTNLYDHNDWCVIRHHVCRAIVLNRCDGTVPGSCDDMEAEADELCGVFQHCTTYPAQ
jgi:hypothetical protein